VLKPLLNREALWAAMSLPPVGRLSTDDDPGGCFRVGKRRLERVLARPTVRGGRHRRGGGRCRGDRRRSAGGRDDNRTRFAEGLPLLAQDRAPLQDVAGGDRLQGLHGVAEAADVSYLEGDHVFGDKIQGRNFPPRWAYRLQHVKRL